MRPSGPGDLAAHSPWVKGQVVPVGPFCRLMVVLETADDDEREQPSSL